MKPLTASIQVFANHQNHEEDASRAEAAVNLYLGRLPSDAALCLGSYMAEMRGETHDAAAAARWRDVDAEAHRIAQGAALGGWARPENADVQIEYCA